MQHGTYRWRLIRKTADRSDTVLLILVKLADSTFSLRCRFGPRGVSWFLARNVQAKKAFLPTKYLRPKSARKKIFCKQICGSCTKTVRVKGGASDANDQANNRKSARVSEGLHRSHLPH